MADNNGFFKTDNQKLASRRRENNKVILKLVKQICADNGGASEIGDGYVIVNTNRFNVTER